MALQTEKYSVAWFKLAEFITRGEKERALGIYKLLAHSLQDEALSAQLRGDILLSFNDHAAIHEYQQAAHIYETQAYYIQAIAIYEQLLILAENDTENTREIFFKLLMLSLRIQHTTQAEQRAHDLTEILLKLDHLPGIELLCQKHQLHGWEKVTIQKSILVAYSKQTTTIDHFAYHLVEQIITQSDTLLIDDYAIKVKKIHAYFETIKSYNQKIYDYAVTALLQLTP